MANYDATAVGRPLFTSRSVCAPRSNAAVIGISGVISSSFPLTSVQRRTDVAFYDRSATEISGSSPATTTYYQMRAVDPDCVLILTYRSWIVTGSPDYTGAQYSGPRCGVSPLTNIVVVDTWTA